MFQEQKYSQITDNSCIFINELRCKMDQEQKPEENKEVKAASEETKLSQPPKKHTMNLVPVILLLAGIGVAITTIINYANTNKDGEQSCVVVPQAAFGQSQAQSWIQMDNRTQAAIVADFDLTVPDNPSSEYTVEKDLVYTKQIYEIRYFNASDEEGLRITKGKMCGQVVYDVTEKYRSTNIVTVDGREVTEYGDGTTISIATWTSGEFSYFIGAWNAPMTKDAMETLISKVQ